MVTKTSPKDQQKVTKRFQKGLWTVTERSPNGHQKLNGRSQKGHEKVTKILTKGPNRPRPWPKRSPKGLLLFCSLNYYDFVFSSFYICEECEYKATEEGLSCHIISGHEPKDVLNHFGIVWIKNNLKNIS